jgi:hypothetical protein
VINAKEKVNICKYVYDGFLVAAAKRWFIMKETGHHLKDTAYEDGLNNFMQLKLYQNERLKESLERTDSVCESPEIIQGNQLGAKKLN